MGATGSGILGFLGSCACFCNVERARGLREEGFLFVALLQTAPFGCCSFRFSHILPEDSEFCS